ncbi:MAG: class I SAM-dependent methyltransferase [Pseudomonadota bacterium]
MQEDTSNGYEAIAEAFMKARSDAGLEVVSSWTMRLPKGSSIIDVGAGHGLPVTQALVDAGLDVYAIEPAPTLFSALRHALPGICAACEPAETSTFFDRQFDAVISIGLIFLLEEKRQAQFLKRLADALKPGGRLLFSAPHQKGTWNDLLTGRPSFALGRAAYKRLLSGLSLTQVAEHTDKGGSNYFEALKVN